MINSDTTLFDASISTDLFDACHLLFGPDIRVSNDFLNCLQPSGLKAAYRKKVLETHPDRAQVLGQDEGRLQESFRRVSHAYAKLNAALAKERKAVVSEPKSSSFKGHKKSGKKVRSGRSPEYFFSGRMPGRKLLIGQFIFYSGLISWNSYIRSIIWQRKQRPPVGNIALGWGMLSEKDIKSILMKKDSREKFGASAVRRGYLNLFQLYAILGKQRNLQQPIGEYFIKGRIFSSHEMKRLVLKQDRHNRQFPFN